MFSRLDWPLVGLFASFAAILVLISLGAPWYASLLPAPPLLVCFLSIVGKRFGPALLIWAMSQLAERSLR